MLGVRFSIEPENELCHYLETCCAPEDIIKSEAIKYFDFTTEGSNLYGTTSDSGKALLINNPDGRIEADDQLSNDDNKEFTTESSGPYSVSGPNSDVFGNQLPNTDNFEFTTVKPYPPWPSSSLNDGQLPNVDNNNIQTGKPHSELLPSSNSHDGHFVPDHDQEPSTNTNVSYKSLRHEHCLSISLFSAQL